MHRPCVADAGSLKLLNKTALTRRIGALSGIKREALDAALRFALGLD
jgi:mRNA-degrading endonuclease toxin of MazEF toxin-antitoxin module